MKKLPRCINLDWLECYCLEDPVNPLDIEKLQRAGWVVTVREYGTRLYNDMWKLSDHFGNEVLEVRRNPKGGQNDSSILPMNACHIRLCNRACYSSLAVNIITSFFSSWSLFFISIYRVDICLDFELFDSGDDPRKFVARYIKGKYAKINQSEGHAHFSDEWSHKTWNSLSWGKKKSPISTKLYLKTLELSTVKDKPYIWRVWMEAGLIDNPLTHEKRGADGVAYKPDIWRIEFSIKSDVKRWVRIELDGKEKKYYSIRNTLDMYDSPDKLLSLFACLAQHYFRFVKYRHGKPKFECPPKTIFKFSTDESFLKVEHPSTNADVITDLERLLKYLEKYRLTHFDPNVRNSVDTIIEAIKREDAGRFCENRNSAIEIAALQFAIAEKMRGSDEDVITIIENYIKAALTKPKLY